MNTKIVVTTESINPQPQEYKFHLELSETTLVQLLAALCYKNFDILLDETDLYDALGIAYRATHHDDYTMHPEWGRISSGH